MQIGAILRRWIEVLATLYLAWRRQPARTSLTGRDARRPEFRRPACGASPGCDAAGRKAGTVLATVPFETGASAEPARSVRDGFVILELPVDKVVTRKISVPDQARKFLSGIVRNQIERLSPWPASSVVYGFAAEAGAADAAAIDVRVLMAARADIDAARQELAALGLPVDRIVARGRDADDAEKNFGSVTLWSRLADTSHDRIGRAARGIGIGIAASVTASLLSGLVGVGVDRLDSKVRAKMLPPAPRSCKDRCKPGVRHPRSHRCRRQNGRGC